MTARTDAVGAIGKRGNGLRPADTPDFVHTSNASSGKNHGANIAVRRRHDDDAAFDAGDGSRHGVHQDRGRIGRLATRNIEAGGIDRRVAHAKPDTLVIRIVEILRQLALVEAADARCRRLQRVTKGRRQAAERGVDLVTADREFGHRAGVEPVIFCSQLQQCHIAARAHIGNDLRDRIGNIHRRLALSRQQCLEADLEIRLPGIQPDRHHISLSQTAGTASLAVAHTVTAATPTVSACRLSSVRKV